MKYSKQDEKMMKHLMEAMQIIYNKNKGKMVGGNFGDFLLDVVHGLSLPFTGPIGQTIIGSLAPKGDKINEITSSLDHSLTGQGAVSGGNFLTSNLGRTILNTVLPIAGEGIYQIAKATGSGKRGRPKKAIQPVAPLKRTRGRPKKV